MGRCHPEWVRRQSLALTAAGVFSVPVSQRLGVSDTTVRAWALDAGMRFVQGRGGVVVPEGARFALVEAEEFIGERVSGRRLTLAGRQVIQLGISMSMSLRAIAAQVGVAVSTVSREIKANSVARYGGWKYDAQLAEGLSAARRPRGKTPKLEANLALRAEVVRRLNQGHSPEQIAGRLPIDFPDDQRMRISHETIYQALYLTSRGALRHELEVDKALRSGRTGRKPRSKLPRRSGRPWLDGHRLSDRSPQLVEEIAGRLVPGNWEGDLVMGPNPTQEVGCSGLVTLVERTTRYTLIGRLPGARDSATVIEVLKTLIASLPEQIWQSLTWDQGSEMAQHAQLTLPSFRPDMDIWFCDPHSPWQRPSNENTNGLIRDFWPKGTDFNTITDAAVAAAVDNLNDRPRKVLGFYTPREKMTELLTGIALRP